MRNALPPIIACLASLVILCLGPVLHEQVRHRLPDYVIAASPADLAWLSSTPSPRARLLSRLYLNDQDKGSAPALQVQVWRGPRSSVPKAALVLDSRTLAPAVAIMDQRQSVTIAEAWELALPLEQCRLPLKAVRVQGSHFAQPDYPLVESLILANPPTLPPELATLPLPGLPAAPVFTGFTGDLMAGIGLEELFDQGEAGLDTVFGDTLPVLRGLDWLSGNLEGAVSLRGKAIPKTWNFRYRPVVLPALRQAGFRHVSLCNNHAWDYGETAFLDTLDHLAQSGLSWSGGGPDLAGARLSRHVRVKEQAFVLASLGAYPNEQNGFSGSLQAAARSDRAGIHWATPANLEILAADLAQSHRKNPALAVFINVHSGKEYRTIPDPATRSFHQGLADMGATVVAAHHPHVLQGFEVRGQSLIFHSLGNFLFPGMRHPGSEQTVIAITGIHGGRIVYFEPRGVIIRGTQVRLDPDNLVLERWYAASRSLLD